MYDTHPHPEQLVSIRTHVRRDEFDSLYVGGTSVRSPTVKSAFLKQLGSSTGEGSYGGVSLEGSLIADPTCHHHLVRPLWFHTYVGDQGDLVHILPSYLPIGKLPQQQQY